MCFNFDRALDRALTLYAREDNICDKGRFCYDYDTSPAIVTIPTIKPGGRNSTFLIDGSRNVSDPITTPALEF